jgi:cytochrome c oxidase cbb3-type subunit 3
VATKIETDQVTGRETTGHEWDGLKELNTPLPKWWLYTFIACTVWAVIYALLYPSFPGVTGYFHGLIGSSTRATVAKEVAAMAAQRAVVLDKIAATPIEQVRKDPALLAAAVTAGRTTFAENCQPCHGAGGEGRVGYPSLADDVWIWGGKLAEIQQTITHGVRSADADARVSQMPKFGADGILKADEIDAVADHVMTLYGQKPTARAAKGATIFAENCAVCHGDNGEGKREVGAPPLKSATHLYGNTRDIVRAQVVNPRQGVMPNWNTRLNAATIRSLAIYVHALGGGE